MNKSLRNLKFLARRHGLCGFDSDYLDKLSPEELAWFEDFARKYYDGPNGEARRRRYSAKEADAMKIAVSLPDDFYSVDDLTPEKQLLIEEEVAAIGLNRRGHK